VVDESDLINSIWDEIEAEDEEWVRELEYLLREMGLARAWCCD
jgi:hypothetical protein